MENTPRWFIKAGLIYAVLGAALGMAMAIFPTSAAQMRFVHIHFNLLGFMTMMVTGVAYHVLPRFNARPIPWPEGAKIQFYLQNIGLVGMAAVHLAGGRWQGGAAQGFFILFAVLAGVAMFIMFYNLYFVLLPGKADAVPDKILKDMKVGTVLDQFPAALAVFVASGFQSLTNPAARNTFAKVVSIKKACEKHGLDCDEFLNKLNRQLFQPGRPAAPVGAPEKEKSPGQEIAQGESCRAETLVGSLIKVYPETKAVFEKHYGEECFSCPGQTFETVVETASMHNVDPELILSEINAVIASGSSK